MDKNIGAEGCPLMHHEEKTYIVSILAESPPLGQTQNYKCLSQGIYRQKLIKSLVTLAYTGFIQYLLFFSLLTSSWMTAGRISICAYHQNDSWLNIINGGRTIAECQGVRA